MDKQEFGVRLKALREKAGVTQQELADKAGLGRYAIAKLEQGKTQPMWETVVRLAEVLGVTCEAFQGTGEGKPARKKK